MTVRKINVNGKEYEFINNSRGNRSGFVHESTLLVNGVEKDTNKCQYYNRTWECYQYQTVMQGLMYNLINRRHDKLKAEYKTVNMVKRMTAKHNEALAKIIESDSLINEYRAVKKELEHHC